MDKIPDVVDKLFAEEFKRRIIENELTLLEKYVEEMKKKYKISYDNQRDASADW